METPCSTDARQGGVADTSTDSVYRQLVERQRYLCAEEDDQADDISADRGSHQAQFDRVASLTLRNGFLLQKSRDLSVRIVCIFWHPAREVGINNKKKSG